MTSATELGKQVEALFLRYVDAGRREVEATLALLQASSSISPPKRSKAASNAPRVVKSSAPKRSREAMAELAEKIVAVIHAHPGVSLRDVARTLQTTPGDLAAPMAIIRKNGSVRSVGARNQMRYFPAFSRSDSRK